MDLDVTPDSTGACAPEHATPAVPAASPAVLSLANDPHLRLEHDGVRYEPVASDAGLGALLFALQPAAVGFGLPRHAERLTLQLALDAGRQFERVLRTWVQRADRASPGLPGRVTVADVRDWVLQAARSVPAPEQERFCWRLARALGPDPWGDGSPAIELSGQQFALFETRFDEAGLPVAEPPAEAGEAADPGDEAAVAQAEELVETAEVVDATVALQIEGDDAPPATESDPAPVPLPLPAKPARVPRAPRRKPAASDPAA